MSNNGNSTALYEGVYRKSGNGKASVLVKTFLYEAETPETILIDEESQGFGTDNTPLDGDTVICALNNTLSVDLIQSGVVVSVIKRARDRSAEGSEPPTDAETAYRVLMRSEGLDAPFDTDAMIQAKQNAFAEISAHMVKRTDLRGKTAGRTLWT